MTDAARRRPGPVTRGSVARVGMATAVTALCGYAVLYLAARELDPAGFSVFGVFWGAFGLVTGAANGLLQQSHPRDPHRHAMSIRTAAARVTHPMRVAAARRRDRRRGDRRDRHPVVARMCSSNPGCCQ